MAALDTPARDETVPAQSNALRYYVLGLLTLIYGLNFLDRTIFNVLIDPIKREFALSDTVMGLLAGFGFVLFYSVLGMPIARYADRGNRRNIVAIGFAFWSAMTALCGLAQNVTLLTLARMGVGIGEAAGTPASQSMIAEFFSRSERPRALGIFAVGTYLGVFMGYFVGGWVSHYYGWRAAFLTAGLPGILIAILFRLTVQEPARGSGEHIGGRDNRAPIGPTFAFLFSQRSYVLVLIGFCLTSYLNYATSAWIPPFLARVHHLSNAEVGSYAGTFKGLFGIAGTLLGGVVVSRLTRFDDRWNLWAPAIASGLAGPVLALCMLTQNFALMIGSLGLMSLLVGFHLGPIFAIAQTVTTGSSRAIATATLLLTATCFGQGVGPLLVGVLNDAMKVQFGTDAVRYSLLSASVATVVGALLFVAAAVFVRRDIARAEHA